MNLSNKNILVPGGSGMIGRELVNLLLQKKCKSITVVSIDENVKLPNGIKYVKSDLRHFQNCLDVTKNIDVVFS